MRARAKKRMTWNDKLKTRRAEWVGRVSAVRHTRDTERRQGASGDEASS